MANPAAGALEIAKAKSALQIFKNAEAFGSPREIAAAKADLKRARSALLKVKPEAEVFDAIRQAMLRPVRLGEKKKG